MEDKQGELFPASEESDAAVDTNNGFTKYIVVGYDENGLTIGIPDGITITVADLWAFAGLLRVKADNFYSYNVDNIDKRVLDAINKITADEE